MLFYNNDPPIGGFTFKKGCNIYILFERALLGETVSKWWKLWSVPRTSGNRVSFGTMVGASLHWRLLLRTGTPGVYMCLAALRQMGRWMENEVTGVHPCVPTEGQTCLRASRYIRTAPRHGMVQSKWQMTREYWVLSSFVILKKRFYRDFFECICLLERTRYFLFRRELFSSLTLIILVKSRKPSVFYEI